MTTRQRLINRTQASPINDYPWVEAALTTDPKQTFYGSGFENMLTGKSGSSEEQAYHGRALLAAALAANRVPLAGLGFDPHHIEFNDAVLATGDAGMYLPNQDRIISAAVPYTSDYGSTIIHEALHRGNEILRRAGQPHIPDWNEENAVRIMMANLLGDPERLDRPDNYTSAVNNFNNPTDKSSQLLSKEFADQLGLVNQAAAQAIALRRPGGPR